MHFCLVIKCSVGFYFEQLLSQKMKNSLYVLFGKQSQIRMERLIQNRPTLVYAVTEINLMSTSEARLTQPWTDIYLEY